MKKVVTALFLVALLTSGLVIGCQGVVLKGSGNLKTENYNISDFTKVDVSHAFQIKIDQSSSYSVEVTVDDNLLEYVTVSKSGETLKIGLKTVTMSGPATLKAKVTMPNLEELSLSGATHGTASGFNSIDNLKIKLSGATSVGFVDISADDVRFDVSGASNVTGDLTSGDTDFNIDGASTVRLKGSASDITVDASGASHAKLEDYKANNADIHLSGASTGTVNLVGRLDADLSGASKLNYIGEPIMGNINTSGGSTLSKK